MIERRLLTSTRIQIAVMTPAIERAKRAQFMISKPLFYFRPEIAHAAFETAAEINVIPPLPRHGPGAAQDLAKVFDRFELLPFVVGAVIEHQKNFTSVIARAPKKIILMAGNRGRQSELRSEKVDCAGFAVILAENRDPLLVVWRKIRVGGRNGAG